MFNVMQTESVDFLKIIQDATALLERAPSDPLFFSYPKQTEIALLRAWTIVNNELQRRVANNTVTDEENRAFLKLQEIMRPLYQRAVKYGFGIQRFESLAVGLVQ